MKYMKEVITVRRMKVTPTRHEVTATLGDMRPL